jgi:6-pyruvoyltetrahydropterin/6-carboxytetrahydropterin synthase
MKHIYNMKFTVSKEFSFEAAHSLPHLPLGHKCRNTHGHSYRFSVECSAPLDDRGFVVDYAEISAVVNPIVARLDHQNLNDLFPFHTTAENISAWLYEEVSKHLPVSAIVFHETQKTVVRCTRI